MQKPNSNKLQMMRNEIMLQIQIKGKLQLQQQQQQQQKPKKIRDGVCMYVCVAVTI